jgi:hypothetical protein
MTKQTQCIRLEPVLTAQCKAKASEKQMTFSEWVRTILRREVGLTKKNGRAR